MFIVNEVIKSNARQIATHLELDRWKTWTDLRAAGVNLTKSAASRAMRYLHEEGAIVSYKSDASIRYRLQAAAFLNPEILGSKAVSHE